MSYRIREYCSPGRESITSMELTRNGVHCPDRVCNIYLVCGQTYRRGDTGKQRLNSVNVTVANQRSVAEPMQSLTTITDDQHLLGDIAFGRYHAIVFGNNRWLLLLGHTYADIDPQDSGHHD